MSADQVGKMIRAQKIALFSAVFFAMTAPRSSFSEEMRYGWSISDQRSPLETQQKYVPGSSSIVSCNYGISIMDDRGQIEPRINSLQRALDQKLGSKLDGKNVILKQYLISWNGGAVARQEVYGDDDHGSGVVPAIMSGMGVDCPREKVPIGWYERSEVANSNPPFISVISVEIGGKTFSERYVVSTDFGYPPPSIWPGTTVLKRRKEYWVKGVALAIDRTNSSFADKLSAELQ